MTPRFPLRPHYPHRPHSPCRNHLHKAPPAVRRHSPLLPPPSSYLTSASRRNTRVSPDFSFKDAILTLLLFLPPDSSTLRSHISNPSLLLYFPKFLLNPSLKCCVALVEVLSSHRGNAKEVLSRGLTTRFGGTGREYLVANFRAFFIAVFCPNWVVRESAIGRSFFTLEDIVFKFSSWKETEELERGHLQHKAWIRLLHWPILSWNEEDVKAAISGFGKLWEVDPLSDMRVHHVSYFRVLIRCQNVRNIPEAINLMVEDRRFRVPIEIESWENEAPILLGEDLDRRLGLDWTTAQETFLRQTGFSSIPAMGNQGRRSGSPDRVGSGSDRPPPVHRRPLRDGWSVGLAQVSVSEGVSNLCTTVCPPPFRTPSLPWPVPSKALGLS
uniref:DUF4283 domain-containing protein n=1 Tax=Ananas comosus var. bracteatus TaxID=296719 RepID=A0A6V7PZ12_ANACO|nr:unnamed protein product [Ananas comosus var. bracteatus]